MRRLTPLSLIAVLSCARPATTVEPMYDILITGGTIVDGSGAPRFAGDIAITGDRIARVSRTRLPRTVAKRTIDATDRVVAPGFIDAHAHLDPILELPSGASLLRQGITTALGGPDGSSPFPLAPYLDSVAAVGTGFNVAYLVGHGTIRRRVIGLDARAPTPDELADMRSMVGDAMRDGAWGLSTGLRYVPGAYATTDEIVALAQVVAEHGGIYTSHLRDEGLGLIGGVAEALEIGRRAGIPVVLTHHKVVGKPMWGASARTLAMVDSARAAGTDVMLDQYPYSASYTSLEILIPTWAFAGGDSAFRRRLDDSVLRDSITTGTLDNILNDRGGGDIARIQFARVSWMPELEGKTLADWAAMRGLAPTPENGASLVLDVATRGGASVIFHAMDEGDVERIMRHPFTMIATDGRPTTPGTGHPHPRWYGTFPRVLGHFVRERGVLALEDAVRKMTSLPASRIGVEGRGRLADGAYADIVIFDPRTIADRATFEQPHRHPAGIDAIIVNGVIVVHGDSLTGARPGRVLRRVSR